MTDTTNEIFWKRMKTWIGSELWDLQSQARNDRSYPADTTTDEYSLNFTAFTLKQNKQKENYNINNK